MIHAAAETGGRVGQLGPATLPAAVSLHPPQPKPGAVEPQCGPPRRPQWSHRQSCL